jgi:hypothetical protein
MGEGKYLARASQIFLERAASGNQVDWEEAVRLAKGELVKERPMQFSEGGNVVVDPASIELHMRIKGHIDKARENGITRTYAEAWELVERLGL